MSNERRKLSPAEELALTTQVNGICILCADHLFYTKKNRNYKNYDIAHIYPLNPTDIEIEELSGESILHEDVNHPDNLIPLCTKCHGKFDKPRTREEYRTLSEKKKKLIHQDKQKELQASYMIEADISKIIDSLYTEEHPFDTELQYKPKEISSKLGSTISKPTQRKIEHNTADYYHFIRSKFTDLEAYQPGIFDLICSQVRTFFLKQAHLISNQQDIYQNMVDWFRAKSPTHTDEGAEIIASFFIQNCEIFQ